MTYTPFPVWPRPSDEGGGGGSGGGADEVYFAFMLVNEADVPTFLDGGTFNSGVSITIVGVDPPAADARIVVIPTGGGLYQSFVSDGTATVPYEVPQLSTFAKPSGDLTGQSALLTAYYDVSSGEPTPNTTYLMIENQLIPSSGGTHPASTFTYFTDGDGGYDIVGGPYVTGAARIFIGPDDPDTAGFTMADGDQWKDTSA